MIDWLNVLYNFLWILGLALLLALVSFAHRETELRRITFRQSLSRPFIRVGMAISFILVGTGLALVVEPLWYKIGWAVVVILALIEGVMAVRSKSSQIDEN